MHAVSLPSPHLVLQCPAATLAVSVAVGCGEPAPQDRTKLEGRLAAARKILDATQRDAAYKGIAWTAAVSDEGDVTKQALQGIGDASARDSLAEDCALKLLALEKTTAATAVAELISDAPRRDKVYRSIAEDN